MKYLYKGMTVLICLLVLTNLSGCEINQSQNLISTKTTETTEESKQNSSNAGKNEKNVDSIAKKDVMEVMEPQQAGDIITSAAIEATGVEHLFYSSEISMDIQKRISGSSYQKNEDITLEQLRYLRVLYYGFDGETHIGEMIVNEKIAEDVLEIMRELYEHQYPIEKMVLIDAYGADDEASMEDNNTSAFNYRKINGSTKLSKHSLGLAVDINPRFNPCVRTKNGELSVEPVNGSAYIDRTQEFPYKITQEDLCYQLFTEHGFTWGGSWNSLKDYQHFEKDI